MKNKDDSWTPDHISLRYNRDERLKRAPKSVQQMYQPDHIQTCGFIKGLTASHGNRSIFFSIIAVSLLIVLSLFLHTDKKNGKLHGIPIALETLRQEPILYINIHLKRTTREACYTLPLTVHVTAIHDDTAQQETKTIEAIYIGSDLRLPVQFSSVSFTAIEVVISAGGKTLRLNSTL